jgi:predicted RNase H-like nuclease (RuvC/YqgF family)
MGNNPVAEVIEEMHQTLSEGVLEKLREIFAWLEKDTQDQFGDLNHFEEMLESISQELPEDINAPLASICGLEIHYAPIRQALSKVRSRPAIEKKRASTEQAMNGAQSQTESHKDTLANLQASRDLKIARKAALEAELRSLSAKIEADNRKIAELPELIEKTQEEAKIGYGQGETMRCRAYQERWDNFRQTISNVRSVIAKYLNI